MGRVTGFIMEMKIKTSSSSSLAGIKAHKTAISRKRKNTGGTTKPLRFPPSKPYEDFLDEDLKDPKEAAAYLTAALEDGNLEVFLLALNDVAKIYGGIGKLAAKARLDRKNLYRMLSDKGNPELSSLESILNALGFRLAVEVKKGVVSRKKGSSSARASSQL